MSKIPKGRYDLLVGKQIGFLKVLAEGEPIIQDAKQRVDVKVLKIKTLVCQCAYDNCGQIVTRRAELTMRAYRDGSNDLACPECYKKILTARANKSRKQKTRQSEVNAEWDQLLAVKW